MADRRKLNALTSLRFIAALLIVIHHSRGQFGFGPGLAAPFLLDQGVSFFFVLSGFVLTYVYPSLDTVGRRRFLLARVARIWPAHCAAIALLFFLLPEQVTGTKPIVLVANLCMVNGWVPLQEVFYSLNSVSWSISTEFGFYLCFPLLISRWPHTWPVKIAFTFLISVIIVTTINSLQLAPGPFSMGLTQIGFGLVYMNPLARVFEFTLGMTAALAWGYFARRVQVGIVVGTLLEATAWVVAVFVMYHSGHWAAAASEYRWVGPPGQAWLAQSGLPSIPFAALIVVMALERGGISRLLSSKIPVLLGEVSYSVYLLHQILLRWYTTHARSLALVPGWAQYLAFWAVLLLIAHLIWLIVERPARQFLVGLWPQSPVSRSDGSGLARVGALVTSATRSLASSWRVAALEVVALAGLLLPVAYVAKVRPNIDLLSEAQANGVESKSNLDARRVTFGGKFLLRGVGLDLLPDGLRLELAWQSLGPQRLEYMTMVHFVDRNGNSLGQADYPQDITRGLVAPGTVWRDVVRVPAAQLGQAHAVGIGLYQPASEPLMVDHGPRDSDGHRLLIALPTGGSYEGVHETADCGAIAGWAWNTSQPNTPIDVDIYDSDILLGRVSADHFRQDLADAGKGDGAHAFEYTPPAGVKDGRQHTILVKTSEPRMHLTGTPKLMQCEK